jgi:DNA polymerase-1
MEEVGFTSRSFATERRRTRRKGASVARVTIEAPVTSRASDPPKRLFLLDGHSLSYRAFFALPTSLQTTTGQITNAVYGFTSMLIKLLTEE